MICICAVGRNLSLQPGSSPNWTLDKMSMCLLLPVSSPGPAFVVPGWRKWEGTGGHLMGRRNISAVGWEPRGLHQPCSEQVTGLDPALALLQPLQSMALLKAELGL